MSTLSYEYSDGGTETIPMSIITGDRAFGIPRKKKCLDYLYYDIYTADKDVSVDILVDGESVQQLLINNSERERKRSQKLVAKEGYRFALQLTCASFQDVIIYAPWELEATPVGD